MKCPKCKSHMEAFEHEGIEVDRCPQCGGIWFDAGEGEQLRDRESAAAIDTGDPADGSRTNQIDRYHCPRCGGGMMRTTDPRHPDVRFEECTSCRGSFFDAGEFSGIAGGKVSDLLSRVAAARKR